jgi:hypothetical protein
MRRATSGRDVCRSIPVPFPPELRSREETSSPVTSLASSTELIVAAIGWFDSKEKATAVVFMMIALFAASAGWLVFRHVSFVRGVGAATSAVRRSLAEGNWSPADRLNGITVALKPNQVMGDVWSHYHATLREDPRLPGGFVNLVDPTAWFAVRNLKGSGYDKWASTWASVFLCLGLLFTFIGLSAALMKVGNVDDAAHLREGINGILSVSSAKFITSIFGILLFIIWVVGGRLLSAGQQGAAAEFAFEVQKVTTLVTPEVLLMDQLLASREQAERMRTLKDDISVAFEAKLSEVVGQRLDGFPEHIGNSIRPIVEAINGMGGSLSQGADDAMGRVADRLEQAAAAIHAAQGGIGSSGEAFGNTVVQAAATMSETVTRMASAFDDKMVALEQRIGGVDSALRQGASSISGITEGMSVVTGAALKQALETISAQAANGAEQARQQAEAAMRPLLQSMQALAEQISRQAVEGSGSLVEGSRSAANLLTSAAGGVGDRMVELEARIGRIDEAMARGAQAIQGVSAGMSDAASATLTRALEAIADQAARAADQTREQTVAAMQPLTQGLQEVMAELRTRAAEGSGHLVAGGKSASEALIAAAGGITTTMAGLEARIGSIDAALSKGSQSIASIGDELSRATSSALGASLETISQEAARGAEQARQQSHAAMEPLLVGLTSLAEQIRDQAAAGRDTLVDGGRAAAETLAAAAERMADQLAAASREASANLQSASRAMADRMDGAVAQFKAVEAAVGAHVGHLARTGTTIAAAGSTFDAAAGQLRQAAEPIKATLASVDGSARKATEVLEAATGLHVRLSESATVMRDSIGAASTGLAATSQTAQSAFEGYSARFEGVDAALKTTIEDLRNGVGGIGTEAGRLVEGVKDQLGDALSKLGMGVEGLTEAVGEMQETADRLEAALSRRERQLVHP